MKILITGARGQLGQALAEHFAARGAIEAVGHADCPVENRARVVDVVGAVQPDVIFNTAAMTDVDGCETDPDQALRINALGARNVALAARTCDSRLVHFSTDFVFSGADPGPLDEWSTPGPINVYGRSKLIGEQYVARLCPEALICRIAWAIGAKPSNFVRRMLALSEKHPCLRVVDDQWGCPTWTVDVAAQVDALLAAGESGVVHTVSNGGCSRFELVREVLDLVGRSDYEIDRASSDEFPTPAARPRDSRLRNRVLDLLDLNRMPDWRQAVANYLETIPQRSSDA